MLDTSLQFSAPGYYRVQLQTLASATENFTPDGKAVYPHGSDEVFILVKDVGGRVDAVYDSTVAASEGGLAFGSVGPSGTSRVIEGGAHRAPGPSSMVTSTYYGTAVYHNQEVAGAPSTALNDGYVDGRCLSPIATANTRTDASGNFTLVFSVNCTSAEARITLIDTYSSVLGGGGVGIGNWMTLVKNGTVAYQITNDWAYTVYNDIRLFAPQANTKFGQNRPRVSIWVSSSNPNYGAAYYSGDDRIKTDYTKVVGNNGVFTTMHEYGHAFQWEAIETPRSGGDCPDPHYLSTEAAYGCAYREGFADFFSWWVAGDSIAGGSFNDEDGETNNWRSQGNGGKIEAAVAAFFYDLVDGTSDRNKSGNTTGADDDSFTWSGSYIGNIMGSCSLNYIDYGYLPPQNKSYTTVNGLDELLICFENSTTVRSAVPSAYQSSWRTYIGYGEGVTEPSGWSASVIRSYWRYNLFNLGSLP